MPAMVESIVTKEGTNDNNTGNVPKPIETVYEKLSVASLDINILFPHTDLKIDAP